jgi:hypothetical protein
MQVIEGETTIFRDLRARAGHGPMNPVTFYIGAAALFGMSVFFLRRTSPYSRCGGTEYERKQLRKLIGEILLISAVMLIGVGVVTELASAYP